MKKFVLLLSFGLALYACNVNQLEFDNIEFQRINGIYGLPLGEIKYTLRDLLSEARIDDESLQEDDTSRLFLTYSDTINYANQNDFIQIDNVSGEGIYLNTETATNINVDPATPTLPELSYTQTYDPQGGQELDSVFYDGGQIAVTVTSNAFVQSLQFSLVFENTLEVATRNEMRITGTLDKPASPGETVTGTATGDLTDHVTILSSNTNEFTVRFGAIATLATGEELTGTETLTFNFTYQDQSFSVIYGKFGQTTAQVGNETLTFDFFDDLGEGIFFDAPIMRFNFENTFGIPMALDFSGLSVDDGAGGNQLFLDGRITDVTRLPEIAAAATVDSTASTTIEISASNSNLRNLFATSPSRILFEVAGTSNYYDTDNSESNFVEPNNTVTASIELEMPLAIRLENFQESFRFNLSGGLDVENVDSAFLRVLTINELPFSGSIQIEIQDENEDVIYTVPEIVEVAATPRINSVTGFVEDPTGLPSNIPLSDEAIDALAIGSFINMILTLNTPQTQTSNEIYVQVLADYGIEIKVGLGGQVDIGF